jgi:hypothetical protein
MNRKDINSINDIFKLVVEKAGSSYLNTLVESAQDTSNTGGDASSLYSYGPEKLRINHFTKQGAFNSTATYKLDEIDPSLIGSDNIVVFFTKKISDNENDVLHNASGPAVIFEGGGEGNEFFFINGKPADLNQALLYLMNWQADLPDIETIDNSWPLEFKTFSIDYQVAPFNPHPM